MVKKKTKTTKVKTKKPKNKVVEWKEEMLFHGRQKRPNVHIPETGKDFVMVRRSKSRGGGVEKLYNWRKYLVSNLKKKKATKTKAKTTNPTTKNPKKRKKSEKKSDNSLLFVIGAGILGFLGYKILKKQSSSAPTTSKKQFVVNAFNKRKRR